MFRDQMNLHNSRRREREKERGRLSNKLFFFNRILKYNYDQVVKFPLKGTITPRTWPLIIKMHHTQVWVFPGTKELLTILSGMDRSIENYVRLILEEMKLRENSVPTCRPWVMISKHTQYCHSDSCFLIPSVLIIV